jgi:hypothetical protein
MAKSTHVVCDRCGDAVEPYGSDNAYAGKAAGYELRIEPHYSTPGDPSIRRSVDICGKCHYELENLLNVYVDFPERHLENQRRIQTLRAERDAWNASHGGGDERLRQWAAWREEDVRTGLDGG